MTRFFQQNSVWYTPVPSSPIILPNSANYIAHMVQEAPTLTVSKGGWSVPIWRATPSTPLRNWTYTNTSSSVRAAIAAGGYNLNVPTDPSWRPGSATSSGHVDGFMTIISSDGNTCWDFRQADVPNLTTDKVRRWDLRGNGIDQPYTGVAAHVAPTPLLHGLVLRQELMTTGVIDHALQFVGTMSTALNNGVYPCVSSNRGTSTDPYASGLGFRYQLNPAVNINTLGLTTQGIIIARALQTYGMIFCVNGGRGYNGVFLEDLEYATQGWGTVPGSMAGVLINNFRVVVMDASSVDGGGVVPSPPPDVTPPVISIQSPTAGATVSGRVLLTIGATD